MIEFLLLLLIVLCMFSIIIICDLSSQVTELEDKLKQQEDLVKYYRNKAVKS